MSLIPHPEEGRLNEYLDGALTAAERGQLEAHLQICPACTTRLGELQRLFAELESLPEEPLGRDLSAGVLASLRPAQPRIAPAFWLGLAAEALAGAALLVFAVQAGALRGVLELTLFAQAGALWNTTLQAFTNGLAATWASLSQQSLAWLEGLKAGLAGAAWQPTLASLPLPVVLAVLAAAALACLVGNLVLLRPKTH